MIALIAGGRDAIRSMEVQQERNNLERGMNESSYVSKENNRKRSEEYPITGLN
jgi:hypothetical protein